MRLHLTLVRDDSKLGPYQLQLLNQVVSNLVQAKVQAKLLHFPIRLVCMAPISLTCMVWPCKTKPQYGL